MTLERWNFSTRKYEPYEVPDTRDVAIIKNNMTDPVDCAICGETVTYGESYTSLAIHNAIGLGFCVCPKCHRDEILHRLSFGGGAQDEER